MSDFQYVHERKQTRSLKWDNVHAIFQAEDILPMWVADMDFQAPDEVNEAIKERADHGIYGYTIIDEAIKTTVQNWVKTKHGWKMETDWLTFSPGVITSLHTAIQTFTEPNDNIVIQTPVYTPFFNLIKNGSRQIVENPLIENDGYYTIDFVDLEESFKQGVKAFILCSPHNPVGRVWSRKELGELARLCVTYDVLILADEIHADLVFPAFQHIPIASLSEEIANQTITCMSPTKTFNLAGLQASYMIIPNQRLRLNMQQHLALQGASMLNTIGVIALDAAYSCAKPWLDEVMGIIQANKQYVRDTLPQTTNGKIKIADTEATYLLWLDCRALPLDDRELQKFMIHDAKVGLNAGSSYGKQGEQFMRINIACPHTTLKEGVKRIANAVNQLV